MAYSVGLHTLGCKVSQYETEAIRESFVEHGYEVRGFSEKCDVYIINTCTVTAESDRKSRQMIRRAVALNPNAVVMVTGCYSQRMPDKVADIKGVAYICGTQGKLRLVEKANELLSEKPEGPQISVAPLEGACFEPMLITEAPRTRAYLKIEDGCECRCTYCAIPDARGPVRSKPKEDVLSEINVLAAGGTREIVLTGIETASYGVDFENYRLIDLLEEIDKKTSIERIRLGSLTPEILRPDFTDRISRLKKIAPHFHISMQSGCDKILRLMKRRYNTEMALAGMARLREKMPRVMFTTDMMVGFPGETEEDFLETMAFTERARFLDMHIFTYSRRENTPADKFPNQVDGKIKNDRGYRLSQLRESITWEILSNVDYPLSVVFETQSNGVWTGHSAEYIEVRTESALDLHGQIIEAVPISVRDGHIEVKI